MAIRDQGLQHWSTQIEKVKQLHSQILVRHGVMLVGPTGGGKTTARNILQRALVLLPSLSLEDDHRDDAGPRKPSLFFVSISNGALWRLHLCEKYIYVVFMFLLFMTQITKKI